MSVFDWQQRAGWAVDQASGLNSLRKNTMAIQPNGKKTFEYAFRSGIEKMEGAVTSVASSIYYGTPTGKAEIKERGLMRDAKGKLPKKFQTVGSLVGKLPLKSFSNAYLMNLPFAAGYEFFFQGKPLVSSVLHGAWDSIPMTLSMELAGSGFKGIMKGMGWTALGGAMGMGPWGSLGLQLVGQSLIPGLGIKIAAGVAAYKIGQGLYEGAKNIYNMGAQSRQLNFGTKDMSYASSEAATMRQRSVAAIEQSHMNLSSVLGNEARLLMG